MRITNKMMLTQSLSHINTQYEQLYKINEKVASGKNINRPSDDPIGMSKILGYRSMISSIEQYEKNIETGTTWLRYTESALANAEQVFVDAKILAEQMATGTYSSEQREMLALQAEQLYDHLVQVANTKVVDRYIFAGFRTSTTPFTKDTEFNIEYHGDDNQIRYTVGQNAQVTVNITGQQAFLDGTNVFDTLRDLRTALMEDDQAATGALLPELDEALTQIVKVRSFVGTAMREMEISKVMIEEMSYNTKELLSNTEDVDLVEAVTKLSESEIAYEASLKGASIISGLTLLEYI